MMCSHSKATFPSRLTNPIDNQHTYIDIRENMLESPNHAIFSTNPAGFGSTK